MNYKKLLLIAVAGASIALAGCGNSAKNMSFQETYNAFWDSHTSKAVEMFNNISKATALSDKGNYMLSGSVTSGIVANMTIDSASTVTNQGLDSDSNLTIKGQISQPGLDDKISLDSAIQLKMVGGQSYINISKLALDSEKGNPQISMIGAFSAILTNKWISLASSGVDTSAALKGLSLSNLYTLPALAVQSLKDHPIFKETSKEMVDGNPVYHVALDASGLYLVAKDIVNSEAIKAFLQGETFTDAELMDWANTFVANASFDGTLTAYSRDNIVLAINRLDLDSAESMKGTIEEDKTHLEVVDTMSASGGTIALVDFAEKGNMTTFNISAPSQELSVQGSVNVKKATADAIAYTLGIVAIHPSFAINFGGDVSIEKTDAVKVEAPTSFQTIDQILGGFGDFLGTDMGDDTGALSADQTVTQ